MTESVEQPVVQPLAKPLSLIPVGLKEAALDSPTFRATTVHFASQVETVERWLGDYVKWVGKLVQEINALEDLVNGFLTRSIPPPNLSEAVVDQDYTILAIRRFAEGAREYWSHTVASTKKMEATVLEPLRAFLQGELRNFKDARQYMSMAQKAFDGSLSRYAAQSKNKEPSALREEAFQLYEARKLYLRASMEFCVMAPQLRTSLDNLLIRIFSDQWREMRLSSQYATGFLDKVDDEVERVRNWSAEMEASDKVFRRELHSARRQLEDDAAASSRPSRELDEYSRSTLPVSATPGLASSPFKSPLMFGASRTEKQGWLFLRTFTGKPTRSVWLRRWFFVRNGIFGWLVNSGRSGGVEEGEQIGVLLCSLRPASHEERRFCFEVKTKDSTVLLQAETQADLVSWFEVFERAKQASLEDSDGALTPAAGFPSRDAATAIMSPNAAALASKSSDGLSVYGVDDHTRPSFDPGATLPSSERDLRAHVDAASRRSTASEKDGEGVRDSAARIIHKLDLHRKTAPSSQLVNASLGGPPASGFGPGAPGAAKASLMSAGSNWNATPTSTGATSMASGFTNWAGTTELTLNTGLASTPMLRGDSGSSSLAPITLTNPPAPTNLSKTAVIVTGERGAEGRLGQGAASIATGVMANFWGTISAPMISRLERDSVEPAVVDVLDLASREHQQDHPQGLGLSDGQPSTSRSPGRRHRNTITSHDEAPRLQAFLPAEDFPPNYPPQLRIQDAQFRVLFPNAPRHDRVLLVFRAAWNPNQQQDFPGRVYVTGTGIHFYSHHLGLVLVTSISLGSVDEVTATAGKEFDYIYLHLKGGSSDTNSTRITIKNFLEDHRLLLRRLKFLVRTYHAGTPLMLETALNKLMAIDHDTAISTPSVDSWEDDSNETPRDAGLRRGFGDARPKGMDLQTTLHIDRDLQKHADRQIQDKRVGRLKLPAEPVVYVPEDMPRASQQREYAVSAKALFHIMFGDKSTMFQMIYLERRAQRVKQHPWVQADAGQLQREYEYLTDQISTFGPAHAVQILDRQEVEVLNDHLCYVVRDTKTPWHLPYWRDFVLVSKIVITHVSKSRCQLAIYDGVEWSRNRIFLPELVTRQALADLATDAQYLTDIVTEQVKRLGSDNPTKKAIQIFGHVGQQAETLPFLTTDMSHRGQRRPVAIRQWTLATMLLEQVTSIGEDVLSSVMSNAMTGVQHLWEFIGAHGFLLALLGLSMFANLFLTGKDTAAWWTERKAARHLSRLGVGPGSIMTRSVSLDILGDSVTPAYLMPEEDSSQCYQTFCALITAPTEAAGLGRRGPSISATSTRSLNRRLGRARDNLGQQRHDLLVALRVVNRLEQELVQAAWEHWLVQETSQCQRVTDLLHRSGTKPTKENSTAPDEAVAAARDQDLDRLKQWHGDYCGSCRQEFTRLEDGDVMGSIWA
ncbi:MAG: hypothetical protein M1823_005433 [Watsoniomyces obsoletus]|nr:MAG: hypothetical protein M1823_005433 [Watsoniomyces obsoletus]